MYITKELKSRVKREAKKLREHATQEELNKLDFTSLYVSSEIQCIYGQMTGSCFSERAIELLNLATKPYSSNLDSLNENLLDDRFPVDDIRDYSPIEFYIVQEGANNKSLIQYLKGESDSLEL